MDELRRQIQDMETQSPLAPWAKVSAHHVRGWMFGFAEKSDLLLVVSLSGRELFDCTTGESIACHNENLTWFNWGMLSAQGIGPVKGQRVRLAGVYGGGLNTMTKEGWVLYSIAPTWPDYRVLLCPPQTAIQHNLAACVQVEQHHQILAIGFSPTGRSFIVAQPHTLHIFAREPNQPI